MNDIDTVAAAGHVPGEFSGAVMAGAEPGHHPKAHEPAVEAVERAAEVLRGSVVLPEGGDAQNSSRSYGTCHHRLPGLSQGVLLGFVREYLVAHQEGNQVEQRFVEVQKANG